MVLIPEFPQRFVKWRQNTVVSEECEVAELTVRSCPLVKTLLTPGAKWRGIGLHVHVLHGILILPFRKNVAFQAKASSTQPAEPWQAISSVCLCGCRHKISYAQKCMCVCVCVCVCCVCVFMYLCIYVSMYLQSPTEFWKWKKVRAPQLAEKVGDRNQDKRLATLRTFKKRILEIAIFRSWSSKKEKTSETNVYKNL